MNEHTRLHRELIRWLPLGALLAVALFAFSGYETVTNIHRNARRARQGHRAELALCALDADISRRIDSTRQFLRNHPKGIDGITAADLRLSLQNSQRTLRALAVLHCPE